MRGTLLLGVVAVAGCLAAAPASAWDVQTTVVFRNQTGQGARPNMHNEVPYMWIESGQEWTHTSYYSGSDGRGYDNTMMTGNLKQCRISVLVRPIGGGVKCEVGTGSNDGLTCSMGIEAIHEERRCRFTLVAQP